MFVELITDVGNFNPKNIVVARNHDLGILYKVVLWDRSVLIVKMISKSLLLDQHLRAEDGVAGQICLPKLALILSFFVF